MSILGLVASLRRDFCMQTMTQIDFVGRHMIRGPQTARSTPCRTKNEHVELKCESDALSHESKQIIQLTVQETFEHGNMNVFATHCNGGLLLMRGRERLTHVFGVTENCFLNEKRTRGLQRNAKSLKINRNTDVKNEGVI